MTNTTPTFNVGDVVRIAFHPKVTIGDDPYKVGVNPTMKKMAGYRARVKEVRGTNLNQTGALGIPNYVYVYRLESIDEGTGHVSRFTWHDLMLEADDPFLSLINGHITEEEYMKRTEETLS